MKRITLLLPLLLLATACVPSRSAIAPTVEPSSVPPPSPALQEVASSESEPLAPVENVPLILVSASNQLVVNPNKTFTEQGLRVEIREVEIIPNAVGLEVRVENVSDKPVRFPSILSTVIVGTQQIEYDSVLRGEFSDEIYPGVIQQGVLAYESNVPLDVRRIDSLKWVIDVGLEDLIIDLTLRPEVESLQVNESMGSGSAVQQPVSRTSPPEITPVAVEPNEPFNAEIFDPPSNCRTGANVNSSVKQALQRGDVLVDRSNTRSDDKGAIWYREKYLNCWIHESQLRFK